MPSRATRTVSFSSSTSTSDPSLPGHDRARRSAHVPDGHPGADSADSARRTSTQHTGIANGMPKSALASCIQRTNMPSGKTAGVEITRNGATTAEEEKHEEEHPPSDAHSHVSPEDTEALLWDAQMALIGHQYRTAVSCMTRAALAGSSSACLSLANIYLNGLPCANHAHKRHVISPSKLIEGSISVDQTKTAAYTLKALELEAAKPSFTDMDLEVVADASLLLCNIFRYGKIRPRDAARITGSLKELAVSPTMHKLTSFLQPLLEDDSAVSPETAWTRGENVGLVLVGRLEMALRDKGINWIDTVADEADAQETSAALDDATIEKLRCSLVCLYYTTAVIKGVQEGPGAVDESIQVWKRLLSCNATLEELHFRNRKSKGIRTGRPPTRQSSGTMSTILEGLVNKAEKRLQLLITAVDEQSRQTANPRHPSPRDILLRRDASENSGSSSLLTPTSEASINFGSADANSPKHESPASLPQSLDKSIDSICNCVLPVPVSTKSLKPPPAQHQTPERKRPAKFAIHDSPGSLKSTLASHGEAYTHSPKHTLNTKMSVPPSLFRGFQTSSRSNLRQSLAGQSMSSSHLSMADMASSASSIAPSTRRRIGDLRRPLLDRRPSQLSLASTSTLGRRAWTSSSNNPISRISNLSSASLHTLAPTTDQQLGKADVSSLPHVQALPTAGAAHYLSSVKSSTSRQGSASSYTGQFRNALSSLTSFFGPSNPSTQSEESSKAQAELARVADQHNAELDNFICWEDGRASSEEESLHSGSPSDRVGDDDAVDESAYNPSRPPADKVAVHVVESPRLPRFARHLDSIPQRPIYPLSTSISSSYLHSSSPTSSPHRARTSSFQPALSAATPTNSAFKQSTMPAASVQPAKNSNEPAVSQRPPASKSNKIDPLLAALEAASRVNVKSKCAICGIQGVNFPKCHRCQMTFCSRDCRMASGGETGKHICQMGTEGDQAV